MRILSNKSFSILFVLFSLQSCIVVYPVVNPNNNTNNKTTETKVEKSNNEVSVTTTTSAFKGKASYYSNAYIGKKTSSGELYDNKKLTAAHKTFPFGTRLEVKNLKNNKTVIVTVNDRLPATSTRLIDLSEAAAQALDMIRDGVIDTEVRVIK